MLSTTKHHTNAPKFFSCCSSIPKRIATKPKAPVNGSAAFATAAPEDRTVPVEDCVAVPAAPELAAEPDAEDLAEDDLTLLALALALAALPLGVGVTTVVQTSLTPTSHIHITYRSRHLSQ